jgi:hypothetical protein
LCISSLCCLVTYSGEYFYSIVFWQLLTI